MANTFYPNHNDVIELVIPAGGIDDSTPLTLVPLVETAVNMATYIQAFNHESSDITQARNYMGDGGKTRTKVTGNSERFTFTMDNKPAGDNLVHDYLRVLEHDISKRDGAKLNWKRADIVAGSMLVYSDITIENIVIGGGESTNLAPANFEINVNADPTIQAIVVV